MSKNEVPLPKPSKKPKKTYEMTLSINTSNALTVGQMAVRAQLKQQQQIPVLGSHKK